MVDSKRRRNQRTPATVVGREFGWGPMPDYLHLRLVKDPVNVVRHSTFRWERNNLPPDGIVVYLVRNKAGGFIALENAAGERLGAASSW